MPTYAYQCQNCGNELEQYQKFTDAPLTKCPKCKKNKLQRVVVPAAIVFKGSGWYKTDSRSKSPTAPKNGHKPAEKTAETTVAESSSDTTASTGDDKAAKPKKEAAAPKSDD